MKAPALGLALACLLLCAAALAQQIAFPPLTGRVVDSADMLTPATEARLTTLLEQHETATTNQVVVVTLPDLQGYTIEEFGYQLGREWGIGQAGTDNGVLLLVAEAERKVRIEVGYGLEGALTDALSSDIIQRVILPQFRRGQFDQGIAAGAEAILQAIAGEYQASARPADRDNEDQAPFWLFLLFLAGFFILPMVISRSTGRGMSNAAAWGALGGMYGAGGFGRRRGGGFGGGGFGGGGFGGGGGGFGGGGGSGGW